VENGWPALSADAEFGGQGMPNMLGIVINELAGTANWSWLMYPGLSHGCIKTLEAHGSPEQKATYLPNLVSGKWTGTMCLTESHCGSDLGLLRTKAEPQADGSYAITGTKIFISAGEHDMSDNIVHIVIARLPDAPRAPRASPCSWCPSTTSTRTAASASATRALRLHRKEDGHQGLGDLRDEL
jgi:alkylation response protein AidB-like acyl-CoA dehydrogenase